MLIQELIPFQPVRKATHSEPIQESIPPKLSQKHISAKSTGQNLFEDRNLIHQKALEISKRFKACERELQEILRQVDEKRVYLHLGYSSLFRYAVDALGLSPDVAYNHISVARKSTEVPELKKAIDQGEITVSQARHVASVLTQENQSKLLGLAKNCTREELRKEVARIAPEKETKPERARYVSEERLALELRVSESLMKKLRRAQDLVSQSKRKFSSLEETLEAMVDCFLEKKDPVRRAERIQSKKVVQTQKRAEQAQKPIEQVQKRIPQSQGKTDRAQAKERFGKDEQLQMKRVLNQEEQIRAKNDQEELMFDLITQNTCTVQASSPAQAPTQAPTSTQAQASTPAKTPARGERSPIPADVKQQVLLRHQGRCTALTPQGKRCSETRWLHFHHIQPVSEGGRNEIENLTLLCSGHHRAHHLGLHVATSHGN